MKKGDFIAVKKGIKDPEYDRFDMSGWTGTINEVFELEEGETEHIIEIQWDIKTLRKLPAKYIELSVKAGYYFSELSLDEGEVSIQEKGTMDNPKERENLILELEGNYESFDEDDRDFVAILKTTDLSVNAKNLATYRKYLIEHLETPVYMTGVELFPWEERFFLDYDSPEHRKLKKRNPSSEDTFKLLKIAPPESFSEDLMAKVLRQSDQKKFEIPLSWINPVNESSENYALLHGFTVWLVNH